MKKDVDSKLKEINTLAEKSRGKVLDGLIAAVTTVEPKLHVNVKRNAAT
jgi:superfamily II helicase